MTSIAAATSALDSTEQARFTAHRRYLTWRKRLLSPARWTARALSAGAMITPAAGVRVLVATKPIDFFPAG